MRLPRLDGVSNHLCVPVTENAGFRQPAPGAAQVLHGQFADHMLDQPARVLIEFVPQRGVAGMPDSASVCHRWTPHSPGPIQNYGRLYAVVFQARFSKAHAGRHDLELIVPAPLCLLFFGLSVANRDCVMGRVSNATGISSRQAMYLQNLSVIVEIYTIYLQV